MAPQMMLDRKNPAFRWTDGRVLEMGFLFVMATAVRLPFIYVTVDDAFITFRYARNIAAGLGFVYNVDERVLGTTTPLFTLFLALSSRLGFDLTVVGKLTNIFADAAAAVLLYALITKVAPRALAFAVAVLFALSPYNIFYSATGMETGLYTLFVLLTVFLGCDPSLPSSGIQRRRWLWLGCVGGVLVLIRPDGWLAIAAIAIVWGIDRSKRNDLIKAVIVAAAFQVAWSVFAIWYFGTPIPNSVSAKALSYRVSGAFDWGLTFFRIFFVRGGLVGGTVICLLSFAGLAGVFLNKTRKILRSLVLWGLLYWIAFTLARGGPYGWYYAPLMPVFFMLVGLAIYDVFAKLTAIPSMARALDRLPKRALQIALVPLLLLIAGVSVFGVWLDAEVENAFEREVGAPIGVWLNNHTPSTSTVALESIGAVGWYSDRYIIDEGGLVSWKVYAVNQLTPGDINIFGILKTFTPDYYVAWQTWELEKVQADPEARAWLASNYEELQQYKDGLRTWILFKRRDLECSGQLN